MPCGDDAGDHRRWRLDGKQRSMNHLTRTQTFERRLAGFASVILSACASLATQAEHRGADAVTQWTLIGDHYGNGAANWRTLAIMQMAMHDALNAAHSVYGRWWPADDDEAAVDGANPEVAMAAAANEVLVLLHPDRAVETAAAFATILMRYPDDANKAAGRRLGAAIGRAAVERRARDGYDHVHYFEGDDTPGGWRPTPTHFLTSRTNECRPFLFTAVNDVPSLPPPALGTPGYRQGLAEVRKLGGLDSSERTAAETNSAYFWAHQSSQRGFVELAVRLLAGRRPRGGVAAEARILAELTAALADSAILTWYEKARYSFWRPITAIRTADSADAAWAPLVETPPFPEYPSGHATDCYVGAAVLEAAFPDLDAPITYLSSAYMEPLGPASPNAPTQFSMGQHAQTSPAQPPGGSKLSFPSLADAATDCANARIWAGAHFAASRDESKRLAHIIVERALSATPAESSSRDVAPP
jgi:hypothetical protein